MGGPSGNNGEESVEVIILDNDIDKEVEENRSGAPTVATGVNGTRSKKVEYVGAEADSTIEDGAIGGMEMSSEVQITLEGGYGDGSYLNYEEESSNDEGDIYVPVCVSPACDEGPDKILDMDREIEFLKKRCDLLQNDIIREALAKGYTSDEIVIMLAKRSLDGIQH